MWLVTVIYSSHECICHDGLSHTLVTPMLAVGQLLSHHGLEQSGLDG